MADDGWRKGWKHRDHFPEIPGMPNRSELMKPLIFPNSQRAFKIFTVVATVGECILGQGAQVVIYAISTDQLLSSWFSFDPTFGTVQVKTLAID